MMFPWALEAVDPRLDERRPSPERARPTAAATLVDGDRVAAVDRHAGHLYAFALTASGSPAAAFASSCSTRVTTL